MTTTTTHVLIVMHLALSVENNQVNVTNVLMVTSPFLRSMLQTTILKSETSIAFLATARLLVDKLNAILIAQQAMEVPLLNS
jgi:hypothetical protein